MYSLKTSENQEVFDVLGGVKRYYLAGNYMLKVNNRNTRAKVWNMFKVNNKDTKTLLTLNIFHTFVLVFLLLTLSR